MTIYKFSVIWILPWPYISSQSFSFSVIQSFMKSCNSTYLDILSWPYISSQSFSHLWKVEMVRYVEEYLLRKLRCSGWEVQQKMLKMPLFQFCHFFSFVGRGLYVKALISGSPEKLWAVFCQILYMDLGHSGWSIHIFLVHA